MAAAFGREGHGAAFGIVGHGCHGVRVAGGFSVENKVDNLSGSVVFGVAQAVVRQAHAHAALAGLGIGGNVDGGRHFAGGVHLDRGFKHAVAVPVEVDVHFVHVGGLAAQVQVQIERLADGYNGLAVGEEREPRRGLRAFFGYAAAVERREGIGKGREHAFAADGGAAHVDVAQRAARHLVNLSRGGERAADGAYLHERHAVDGELAAGFILRGEGAERVERHALDVRFDDVPAGGRLALAHAEAVGTGVDGVRGVLHVGDEIAARNVAFAHEIPCLFAGLGFFGPREGALFGALQRQPRAGHERIGEVGLTQLVAGREGAHFIKIFRFDEVPVGARVVGVCAPCDDVARGAVFVQTVRVLRGIVIVGAVG